MSGAAGLREAKTENSDLPYYESVLIARQDISTTQVEALADGFAKMIEDQGGRVTKREHWGLRTLAYRIRKHRKGHYFLFNIDGPAATVHELERQVRINEDVLRCLTLRVDELQEEPSVMMQSRGVRGDDRDRGRGDDRGRRDDRPRGGDRPEPKTETEAGSGTEVSKNAGAEVSENEGEKA
jgi:small subunit ribosomal protein S6